MTSAELRSIYLAYLDCLNAQDWLRLGEFVHDEVHHNEPRRVCRRLHFLRRWGHHDESGIPQIRS